LRLLDLTFEALQQDNAVSTLPKTYRDAIRVSAQLGVKYLWIDSLCILQDSQTDWFAEASRMRHVYGDSYLTISALSGADDHAGLFYSRDTSVIAPAVVPLRLSHGQTVSLYRSRTENLRRLEIWNEDGVTTQRAWCLQERLLSPRTLHFGRRQIFWECRERCASDLRPESIYSTPIVPEDSGLWKHLIGAPTFDTAKAGPRRLLDSWYATVAIYSKCDLSYASDKLVAIAGLTDDMKQALDALDPVRPCTYVLGLWQEDLAMGLCWRKRYASHRTSEYRLPSWTWASMRGEIYFNVGQRDESFIPLLDQKATRISGEAQEMALSLLGHVVEIEPVAMEQMKTIGIGRFQDLFTHIRYDKQEWLLSHGHVYMISYDEGNDWEEVHLMPLGFETFEDEDGRARVNLFGLLMTAVYEQTNTFKRVGLLGTYRNPPLRDSHPMDEVYEPHLAEKFLEHFSQRRITMV
jgi:hypothetical protein